MSGRELTEFDGEPVDPQSAELHRALVTLDEQADEGLDAFDGDLDDGQAIALVKEGAGRDLLADAAEDARQSRLAETARAQVDDEDDLTVPAKVEPKKAAAEAEDDPETDEATEEAPASPHAALIAAVPEKHRAAVKSLAERSDRWNTIEEIAAPFAEAMKARGETIEEGVRTLAELNAFAMHKPGEYMAWFTSQFVPQENRAKALIALGSAVGVKLIEDEFGLDDEDGEAEQPAALPDPEEARRAHAGQAVLQSFVGAKGPDGQPAHPMIQPGHPLFASVQTAIMDSIRQEVARGGQPPSTIAALRGHYDKAVERVTASMPTKEKAQERVEKARRASAPVSSSPSTPRRATPSTVARSDDDGAEALRSGLEALFSDGAR